MEGRSEGVTDEIRDSIAKTIEKVIQTYALNCEPHFTIFVQILERKEVEDPEFNIEKVLDLFVSSVTATTAETSLARLNSRRQLPGETPFHFGMMLKKRTVELSIAYWWTQGLSVSELQRAYD